jgi:PhnB protein
MTTTTGTDRITALRPYVFFYGRCEEALEFYKRTFGGSYELMRNADAPMAEQVASDFRNKVMHASFTAPGVSFFASDGREAKPIDAEEGNVSLALDVDGEDAGRQVFDALCQGGTAVMPFDDAFWGGKFGVVNDRFGTQWMITAR